jgi:hypothetical protein
VPTSEEGIILNINDPDMLRHAIEPDMKYREREDH